MLGAAGAIEFITCVKEIEEDYIHATVGYKVPDLSLIHIWRITAATTTRSAIMTTTTAIPGAVRRTEPSSQAPIVVVKNSFIK